MGGDGWGRVGAWLGGGGGGEEGGEEKEEEGGERGAYEIHHSPLSHQFPALALFYFKFLVLKRDSRVFMDTNPHSANTHVNLKASSELELLSV